MGANVASNLLLSQSAWKRLFVMEKSSNLSNQLGSSNLKDKTYFLVIIHMVAFTCL